MIATILKAYWKPLVIIALLSVIAIGCRIAWVSHGETQYDSGYAQAQADQKQSDDALRKKNEQEKAQNEKDAQQRIDQARNDALDAAHRAGRLQQQLASIRRQLQEHNAAIGSGSSAANTGVLLTDVLGKSLERNRQLAEYADRAAEAGRVCEKQYEGLTK